MNTITIKPKDGERYEIGYQGDHNVNKIVFTDGYSGEMPKDDLKNMNVIWLIYDNKTFNPVCGKVIYISRSQIRYNYMENAYFANGGR